MQVQQTFMQARVSVQQHTRIKSLDDSHLQPIESANVTYYLRYPQSEESAIGETLSHSNGCLQVLLTIMQIGDYNSNWRSMQVET